VILCKGGGTRENDYERVIPCWTRQSKQSTALLKVLPRWIGWRIGLGNGYSIEQTSFAWNLIKVLRTERIDILHVQDPHLAILCQRARHIGLIATSVLFGHVTEEPPELLQQIQCLYHVAPWHEQQFSPHRPKTSHQTMIPNFVDTECFSPGESTALRRSWTIPQDAVVVLVSSAIKRKHKRIDYLIEEFATVQKRRPDQAIYWLFSGGREVETDELMNLAQRRLGDRVRFAIQHPRHEMPDLYRMSDVFVHGSLFEMFGVVLLEAMASGVPCIAHEHPVMSWVIGEGGITADLTQSGVLADRLIELVINTEQRKEIAKLARQRCQQVFDQDVVVDQFLQLYSQMLIGKRSAA
jgi:glycosyltransferase involved in cell wall biosynthesis